MPISVERLSRELALEFKSKAGSGDRNLRDESQGLVIQPWV